MSGFDDDWLEQHMNAMHQRVREVNDMMNSVMSNTFGMLAPPINGALPSNGLMDGRLPGGGLTSGPPDFPVMANMPDLPRLTNVPGNAAYSSRAVYSMSTTNNGQPQVYQAAMSTKIGPDGVRETRKMLQDSVRGIKKMAIEKQIGDRARIIEKQQNLKSGELEEHQEFVNLDEQEAEEFDREFANKLQVPPFGIQPFPLGARQLKPAGHASRSTLKSRHPSQKVPDLPTVTGQPLKIGCDSSHKLSAYAKPSSTAVTSRRFSPPSQQRGTASVRRFSPPSQQRGTASVRRFSPPSQHRGTASTPRVKSTKQPNKKPKTSPKSPTKAKRGSKD